MKMMLKKVLIIGFPPSGRGTLTKDDVLNAIRMWDSSSNITQEYDSLTFFCTR